MHRNANALAGAVDWRLKVEDVQIAVQKLTIQQDAMTQQLQRIECNQVHILNALQQLLDSSAPRGDTMGAALSFSESNQTRLDA